MRTLNSVFIVDDDPIIVFGIKKMLSNLVVCEKVSSFSNGQLAIDGIKDTMKQGIPVPDVIFLDINMPIMDGWQFLAEFIQLPIKQKVRINIVTSSIDKADRKMWNFYECQSHHLITYNNKPLKKDEMREIAKKA